MTRELFWLTLTVIMTGLLWIPYMINRYQVRGLSGVLANPSRITVTVSGSAKTLVLHLIDKKAAENIDATATAALG